LRRVASSPLHDFRSTKSFGSAFFRETLKCSIVPFVKSPVHMNRSIRDTSSFECSVSGDNRSSQQRYVALSKVDGVSREDFSRFYGFDYASRSQSDVAPPSEDIGIVKFGFTVPHEHNSMDILCDWRERGRTQLLLTILLGHLYPRDSSEASLEPATLPGQDGRWQHGEQGYLHGSEQ